MTDTKQTSDKVDSTVELREDELQQVSGSLTVADRGAQSLLLGSAASAAPDTSTPMPKPLAPLQKGPVIDKARHDPLLGTLRTLLG